MKIYVCPCDDDCDDAVQVQQISPDGLVYGVIVGSKEHALWQRRIEEQTPSSEMQTREIGERA